MKPGPPHATSTDEVESLIAQLEKQMPEVQMRHADIFALANAWAERYDAVIAATPRADRPGVEARLGRIGIRWGVMPGARVTTEFCALASQAPQREPDADPPAMVRRRKA